MKTILYVGFEKLADVSRISIAQHFINDYVFE